MFAVILICILFAFLTKLFLETGVLEEDVDYSKILNPQCGEWHHLPLKTVEFSATSPLVRTNLVKEDYTIPALRLYTGQF